MLDICHNRFSVSALQALRLVLAVLAITFVATSCNGVKPDPNSFDFVNSRGDP